MKGIKEVFTLISAEKVVNMDLTKKNKKFHGKNTWMYILLLPALAFTFVFGYMPLAGLAIAFKDYDVLKGFFASDWVGFKHFVEIFTMPSFVAAVRRTLLYSIVCLFGNFPFPIMLAIMINEVKNSKLKRTIQTISYLPHFLSWMSVIGFAYSLLSINGTINDVMVRLLGDSYERKNFLFQAKNFLPIIFTTGLWKGIGWSAIIYLAAICGIDQSLYEAADIDGCGRFKKIWYITLPCIKTTAVLVLILGLGGLVNSNFEQVYGFQNVFIQNDTDVINTLTYREGIQSGHYSSATAFGMAQGIVSLMLVMGANAISKKVSSVSLW